MRDFEYMFIYADAAKQVTMHLLLSPTEPIRLTCSDCLMRFLVGWWRCARRMTAGDSYHPCLRDTRAVHDFPRAFS